MFISSQMCVWRLLKIQVENTRATCLFSYWSIINSPIKSAFLVQKPQPDPFFNTCRDLPSTANNYLSIYTIRQCQHQMKWLIELRTNAPSRSSVSSSFSWSTSIAILVVIWPHCGQVAHAVSHAVRLQRHDRKMTHGKRCFHMPWSQKQWLPAFLCTTASTQFAMCEPWGLVHSAISGLHTAVKTTSARSC